MYIYGNFKKLWYSIIVAGGLASTSTCKDGHAFCKQLVKFFDCN